ncbi:MAG: hypothetical protein LUI87_15110, partial [Lachnospiraceae bacterium]|nr:hypothetical protein [Lachnospiraceae bacterium]
MYSAIYVLQYYRVKATENFNHVLRNKIMDEFAENGTFRPPYREAARGFFSIRRLRFLSEEYLAGRNGILKLEKKFGTISNPESYLTMMMGSLLKASSLLYGFKTTISGDSFAIWYRTELSYILSRGSELDQTKQDNLYFNAMRGSRAILNRIQDPYYHSSDGNILGISQLIIEIIDYNPDMFTSRGLDKRTQYSLTANVYEIQGKYSEADRVYWKLFEQIIEDEKQDTSQIERILGDVFTLAKKRKEVGLQESYERYIRFAWNICCTNRKVSTRYCDRYMKELRTFETKQKSRLLTDAELTEYRSKMPKEQEMKDIVYSYGYKELYEALKVFGDNDEDVLKISDQFILMMRSKMNIHHIFVYDASTVKQNCLHVTKILFAYIYETFMKD